MIRKTVKILELLSINGLCHIVDIPHNKAVKWIEDYNFYIPETKRKDVVYYHPEAINVLKFIKKCKSQKYKKPQIMEMLAGQNFLLPIEDTTEDETDSLDNEDYKENVLTVMQTIGKTVASVSDQKESIKDLQEQQHEQKKRIKNTEKQTQEINELKRKIEKLRQEKVSLAKEYQMKKRSFAKLFENR
ncbi:hypothetical protein CFK37_17680 [Virgibacillus phasianinus]|uniref:HTH merR-type domain-containing protein n=1 Tax=Virgibacillus phasianinus TaxID=2017483 RepID=A0A220U6S8_9BACI|nr:MerR family transcriptional regulator [Virgibacillus phasianinus]ASK63858.1 hypothetical protein CFK37_17680 [Virgibacillus phasianinus]